MSQREKLTCVDFFFGVKKDLIAARIAFWSQKVESRESKNIKIVRYEDACLYLFTEN